MKSQYFCTNCTSNPPRPPRRVSDLHSRAAKKTAVRTGKLWILLAREKNLRKSDGGKRNLSSGAGGTATLGIWKSQALNAHNFSLLVLSNFDNPTWPPSYPMVGSLCIFLFSSPCSALLTPSPLECLLCCFFLLRAQSDLSQALPEHDLTALVP